MIIIKREELLIQAKNLQNDVVNWRRFLHENPEIGMDVPNTSKFVYEKLLEIGLKPSYIGKNSVTAMVGKKEDGKVILLRADMDALPIIEETNLEFSSKNEYMHACGHDTHTSMLLGAAKILKDNEDIINGRIKLIFQSGEETLEGAKNAIENGALENPKVDAGMMLHITTGLELPHGMVIAFTNGPCYSSSDWFDINIQGKGGHGSTPEVCIDPNSVMVAIHSAIQQYISMGLPATEAKVCTIGKMQGGTSNNIIPDTATMAGTIRTFNEEIREKIKKYIVNISKTIAEGMGATADVVFSHTAPALVTDPKVSKTVVKGLREIFGNESVIDANEFLDGKFSKIMGSEDFAYFAEKIPSVAIALSAGSPSKGYKYAAHHPKTAFDEDVFYIGVATYVYTGLYWLENQE